MFMIGYLLLLLIGLLLDSKAFGPFAAACCRKKVLVYFCILVSHVMSSIK